MTKTPKKLLLFALAALFTANSASLFCTSTIGKQCKGLTIPALGLASLAAIPFGLPKKIGFPLIAASGLYTFFCKSPDDFSTAYCTIQDSLDELIGGICWGGYYYIQEHIKELMNVSQNDKSYVTVSKFAAHSGDYTESSDKFKKVYAHICTIANKIKHEQKPIYQHIISKICNKKEQKDPYLQQLNANVETIKIPVKHIINLLQYVPLDSGLRFCDWDFDEYRSYYKSNRTFGIIISNIIDSYWDLSKKYYQKVIAFDDNGDGSYFYSPQNFNVPENRFETLCNNQFYSNSWWIRDDYDKYYHPCGPRFRFIDKQEEERAKVDYDFSKDQQPNPLHKVIR